MRTLVLRVLLGLVALALGFVLRYVSMPLHYAYLFTVIVSGCGLCSVLGLEYGERMFLFLLTGRDIHRNRKNSLGDRRG